MSLTSASSVADYILCYFHDRGDNITHLKLQKLVYYIQGWFIGIHDETLFRERLEAWVRGPVQPELYQRFKDYDFHPIDENPKCPEFIDKRIKKLLEYVLDKYGYYTALELEKMTHKEFPWINARRGLSPNENGNEAISIDSMKEFFENELEREEYEDKIAFMLAADRCFRKSLYEED